jgi:hypothetical protein
MTRKGKTFSFSFQRLFRMFGGQILLVATPLAERKRSDAAGKARIGKRRKTMRTKTWLIITGLTLSGLGFLNAQEKPTVSVMPDKVLYAPGETAKFAVTVSNGTPASVQGTLAVKVLWEMEDCAKIKEEAVTLAPGEKKTTAAEWKTSDVLGCEVRADLTDDRKVIAVGAEYFNVCQAKDVQRVGIHSEHFGLFTYSDKSFLDAIPGIVADLRRAYVNLMENTGWAPDNYADLAPQRDEWASGYWQSKTAILKMIAEEHKHGMKSYAYVISVGNSWPGLQLLQRHPEWFFYQENGQLWSEGDVRKQDFQRDPDLRAGPNYDGLGWALGAFPNFALKETLEYGVQQLIASKKMFDWDGVRFDGHFLMWNSLGVCPGARDLTGKMVVTGKEAEAITRSNTDYTRRKVAEIFPDYPFMFNSSAHECDIAEICRDGGATANELIKETCSVTSQWHTWKAFTQFLLDDVAAARKFGGYAYAYMNPPWLVCPNVDSIQYAILFAAGDHPWFAFPRKNNSDKGGSHYDVQRNYFQFATRFSAALWGRGIERVAAPEEIVEVSAPQRTVWWRDFVHRRKLANSKQQLVIHLINAPPTPNIEAETQQLSAPVKDITVKFKKPVSKAWLATSEPQLTYQALPVDGGTVKVPELRVWSMIIAEMEGK